MKIISSLEQKAQRFSDLTVGDVFRGVGGDYYIKINELKFSSAAYNAFNLSGNNEARFNGDTEIFSVYAELHVKKWGDVLDE